MSNGFIISLDLGTTGNRVFCFDESGRPISSAYKEFSQLYPRPGWVEHDPLEIWDSVGELIPLALKNGGLSSEYAISLGITNQRETTVLWNRKTGKPLYNAIVWQCRRTADLCNRLKESGHEKLIRDKTGLVIDAYFSGTKIQWLLENVKGARDLSKTGDLLFGTIDTWILWNLTGGKSHKTDYTNASRTMLLNIAEKEWDTELLNLLDIPPSILPGLQASASLFGTTENVPGLKDGIPVGGIAGDQQAALIGQNCVREGTLKNTYGTGCFLLLNTGNSMNISEKGLLTTLACDDHGKPAFALEGSVFVAGSVIQWLRDYMKFFDHSSDSGLIAESVEKEDEIVFIPAFFGLGAPYWKMEARGAIFGLTRDTTPEQITRAAMKSIAFQSMDVIEVMEEESGDKILELKADGGATKSDYLMQFQSDIIGTPVLLPEIIESTALGAAYLAGISQGLHDTIGKFAEFNKTAKKFIPKLSDSDRMEERRLWKNAIKRLL